MRKARWKNKKQIQKTAANKRFHKKSKQKSNKLDENFTKYLQIDDDKTVDYNKDTNLDDLETVDYNNDIYLDDLETIGYKSDAEVEPSLAPKTSVVKHQAAKKIIKKYKNLKRKGQPITYAKTNKKISKEAQIAKDNVSALMNKKCLWS